MKDYTNGPTRSFWSLWWHFGALWPLALGSFSIFLTALSFNVLRDAVAFDERGVTVIAEVIDRRSVEVRRDDRTETD